MRRILLYILLLTATYIYAQHGWQRVNYMQSTIFSANITINDKPIDAGNVLGAFVNDECRMIATTFKNNDSTYVSSVIHGDVPETINFKLWLADKDSIINVKQTVLSKPGGNLLLYRINIVME